jgi:hypothetical protein
VICVHGKMRSVAHCLDAKLDSWTKVFADGGGHAAQLANSKLLTAHDDRLA